MLRRFAGYDFEGPFASADEIGHRPGVIAVFGLDDEQVAHAEYSQDLASLIERTNLTSVWAERTGGRFVFWVYYTDKPDSEPGRLVQQMLRFQYHLTYRSSLPA